MDLDLHPDGCEDETRARGARARALEVSRPHVGADTQIAGWQHTEEAFGPSGGSPMYPHDCSLRHPVGGLGLPQVRSARGLFSLGCIIIFLTCFSFPLTVSLSSTEAATLGGTAGAEIRFQWYTRSARVCVAVYSEDALLGRWRQPKASSPRTIVMGCADGMTDVQDVERQLFIGHQHEGRQQETCDAAA